MVTPHFISCSKFLKMSVSKKSVIDISNPSQIFFIVTTPGFLLWLYIIDLTVVYGMPDKDASLQGVIFLS